MAEQQDPYVARIVCIHEFSDGLYDVSGIEFAKPPRAWGETKGERMDASKLEREDALTRIREWLEISKK